MEGDKPSFHEKVAVAAAAAMMVYIFMKVLFL